AQARGRHDVRGCAHRCVGSDLRSLGAAVRRRRNRRCHRDAACRGPRRRGAAHARGVQRSRRDPATRAALDAANATFVAVICFGLLTGISTQLQSVRPQAPWEVDPYDAVASFAMMIVPIVALLTWIRKARWRREAT